jgi:hypothetical protein
MKVIYDIFKFELNDHGGTYVKLPLGTEFLHASEKDRCLNVWLKVPRTVEEKVGVIFEIKYTGEVAPNMKHLQTFFSCGNTIVNHLFSSMKLI